MNTDPDMRKPNQKRIYPSWILLVVWGYVIFASLWILLSDKAIEWMFNDPLQLTLAATLKGWLFVVITSLLLFGLIKRILGESTEPGITVLEASSPGRWMLPMSLLMVAILALTAMGVVQTFVNLRNKENAWLQAIAELKTQHIFDWLQERRGDAEFLQTNPYFTEHYQRWIDSGDPASRELLQTWLENLRQHRSFSAYMLLDAQGNRLLASDRAPKQVSPVLREAAHLAVMDHQVHQVGPYRGIAGNLRLDFVAPMTTVAEHSPLVVMHSDPTDWLDRVLHTWPVNTVNGDMFLCRLEGDRVVFLTDLADVKGSALKESIPLTDHGFFTAKVFKDAKESIGLTEGHDEHGTDALGVVKAIPGTDWFLIAKLDRLNVYQEALQDSIWIGLAGLLTMLMVVSGFYLLRQRQQLAVMLHKHQSQAERLHALELLAAVADSSSDAIFATDMDGRYILFNRAASRFVDKPIDEVLGRDDYAIFPFEQADMLMAVGREVIEKKCIFTQEEELDTCLGKRLFLTTKGPLRDASGDIMGLFGIARDITEIKQAEQALRLSEKRYRSLFENMMNSVVHARIIFQGDTAVDLEYLSTNPAFAKVTGISEPVIGRKVSEVIPGYCQNNRDALEIFGRVATTGESTRWEHYLKELDRWFSFMIYSPSPGEVILVTENITERKRVEEQLRVSEERLQLALQATNDGLWDWDLRSGLAYLSPHYYEITGYLPDEVIPDLDFFKRIVHPDDLPHVMESMEAHLQGRTAASEVDYRLITRSGEVKWISGRGRVVQWDAEGVPLRMIGTITDITIRKSAEEALRLQSQELAQRNDELERFNRATVGRELDMIALKQQVNELSSQLGLEPPHSLDFLNHK